MARIHSTDQPHGLKGVPSGGPQPVEDDGDQQISWLLQRSRPAAERPHHYLLLLRFTLFNMVAFALLGAAWVQGWIETVLAADRSFLCLVIFGVFLAGLAVCSWRVWQTSRDLNQVKSFDPLTSSVTASYFAKLRGRSGDSRALLASSLRLKLSQRIGIVRQVAGSLVLLGLIGTVIGFIIALSGVDPSTAADVKSIAPMVSTMIEGMSTALFTTLVGGVLNLWLMVNYRLLYGGTVKLITALIELGEEHARA
ncbi:MAG: MotA/TolQ/ExbB proton channel family protein [Rhodospirillales bacterium]|nr:MotA/TolQ/ExbB proton channel family protein [Rhodospirillales bacterium]